MKNNLFKKFLALFLTGTMLAGVGCKDYDDDIDSINKRLDGMDVTVADLQTQITNVKNSIPTLDELNKKVNDLTNGLNGVKSDISSINKEIDAIGDVQAKLNTLKSDLQAYVNGKVQSSEQTLRKEIATKATASDIEKAVKALKDDLDRQLQTINDRISKLEGASTPDYSGDIQALKDRLEKLDGTNGEVKKLKDSLEALGDINNYITKNNLAAEINNLKENPSWLGDAMTGAIQAYKFPYVDATGAADAAVTELLNKMGYANQDYTESLIDLIKKQLTKENLSAAISEYEGTIKPLIQKLDARMFELEGRIQSMVFVPSSLSEAIAGIYFEASQSIELKNAKGEKKTIQLGTQVMPEAEMKFRVSPAAAVAKIQAAYNAFKANNGINPINIVPEKINITRTDSEKPSFEVKNVIFDTKDGTFTVTATTDYKFGSEANKTLAIAVNVTIANANDKAATEDSEAVSYQGIDFTSAYIGCYYTGSATLTANDFVVAYKNEKGDLTEYNSAAAHATELQYNKEGEKVTFFDGFGVYYKTSDQKVPYAKLDTMWNGALASLTIAPDAKKGVATVPATIANKGVYELTNTSAMILSGKSNTGLINDVITSKAFAFSVKDASNADYTLPIFANAVQTVKITAVNTDVNTSKAALAWEYAKAIGDHKYPAANIVLEQKLTGKVYKEIKETAATVTVLNDKGAVAADLTATISLISTPDDESTTDTQKAEIELTDNKNLLKAAGSYTIKAEYTLKDNTTVTILIPVEVTGMPEIAKNVEVVNNNIVIKDGVTEYAVETVKDAEVVVAEKFWNEAVMKTAFGSKAEFVKAFETAVFTPTADKQGSVLKLNGTENKTMRVIPGSKAEKETAYTLEAALKADWGLNVKYTAKVTFKYPSAELTQGLSYNGGKPIVDAQIVGSKLNISGLKLKDVYAYTGNESGVTVEFIIKNEAAKKAGAKVENGNELTWGNWSERTIAMEAVVKLGSYTLSAAGEYPFTATLTDPVAETIEVGEKTLYASNTEIDNVMLADLLTLTAINGNNIFNRNGNDGLDTDLKAALCINLGKDVKPVVYALTDDSKLPAGVKFDNESGTLTVEKIEGTIPTDTAILKFNVTFNYWFGQRTAVVTVLVKPESEKPAPTPEQ